MFVPLRGFANRFSGEVHCPHPGRSLFLAVVSSLVGVELVVISRAAHIQNSWFSRWPGLFDRILRSFTSGVMPEAQLLRCFQNPSPLTSAAPNSAEGHLAPALRVCVPSSLAWLSQRPCGGGSQAPSHPLARTRGSGLTQPPSCPPGITDSFVSEARGPDLIETPSCFCVVAKTVSAKTVTRSSQVNHQLDSQLKPM